MFICYLDALGHMTNSVSALGTEDTKPCVLVIVLKMNTRVSQGYIERVCLNQTAQQQNLDRYHTYVMGFIRIYCQITTPDINMKFYRTKSCKRPVFSGETLTNFRTEKAV